MYDSSKSVKWLRLFKREEYSQEGSIDQDFLGLRPHIGKKSVESSSYSNICIESFWTTLYEHKTNKLNISLNGSLLDS